MAPKQGAAARKKTGTGRTVPSRQPRPVAWPSEGARRRLAKEPNLWLATIRPGDAPHLVPIWFTYESGNIYICTEGDTVKVRNIRRRPQVAFSLEGGDRPVIAFGRARIMPRPWPVAAVKAFRRKYDWDLGEEGSSACLLAIEPSRWLEW